jgi:hypothetical protein
MKFSSANKMPSAGHQDGVKNSLLVTGTPGIASHCREQCKYSFAWLKPKRCNRWLEVRSPANKSPGRANRLSPAPLISGILIGVALSFLKLQKFMLIIWQDHRRSLWRVATSRETGQ